MENVKHGKARKKFGEEWKHFLRKTNFGASCLDTRAITFMNTIEQQLNEIEKEARDKK